MNIKEVLKGLWAIPDTMRESLENVEAELSRAFDEQPAEEAQELAITGDMVPLIERAVHPDGAVTVKIIQPGWGARTAVPGGAVIPAQWQRTRAKVHVIM